MVMRRDGGHSWPYFNDRSDIDVRFFVVSVVKVKIVLERRGRGWGRAAGRGWWGLGVRVQEFIVTVIFYISMA